MRRLFVMAMALFVGSFLAVEVFGQRRIVELEIAASRYEPIETQQRWMKMLSKVGADRIRSQTSGTGVVKVSETELSGTVRIKVQGAIDKGKLVLPGKSFTIRQQSAVAEYLRNLREDGANVALAEKKAFGLTSQQLVDLNSLLSRKLNFKTKGKPAKEVIRNAQELIGMKLVFDSSAKKALAGSEAVLDELDGFSVGTSLAAIARPLGLVLVPRRQRGEQVELHLVDYQASEEFWPIGWPAQRVSKASLPKMYERHPIEIRNAPLDQALKAILVRAKVPMLYDYNSMAIAEIDMSKSQVTYVREESTYMILLRKVLSQTRPRMGFEFRGDENGKLFLWLSTANPVQ